MNIEHELKELSSLISFYKDGIFNNKFEGTLKAIKHMAYRKAIPEICLWAFINYIKADELKVDHDKVDIIKIIYAFHGASIYIRLKFSALSSPYEYINNQSPEAKDNKDIEENAFNLFNSCYYCTCITSLLAPMGD